MTAIQRDRMPWIVTGIVAVVLFAGLGYLLAVREPPPESVRQIADRAALAAERFDVRAGGLLLCDPLTEEQRERLENLVTAGKERADDPDPRLAIEISDVRGEGEGSFRVRVTSPEPGLIGIVGEATVIVASQGGRSCIERLEDEDFQGGLDPY